jgi:hypothetical protein
MRKITSRDIQVFVAGVFAIEELHGLISLPQNLAHGGEDIARPIASIAAALALPLGVAVLAGSQLAVRLAQVYLGLILVCGCVALLLVTSVLRSQAFHIAFVRSYTAALLITAILLALLLWSRSRRFATTAPNQSLEPTAGRRDAHI